MSMYYAGDTEKIIERPKVFALRLNTVRTEGSLQSRPFSNLLETLAVGVDQIVRGSF